MTIEKRTPKAPTLPQYDYLASLVTDPDGTRHNVTTELVCRANGWLDVTTDPDNPYSHTRTVTPAGYAVVDAGRPVTSDKAKRAKAQRVAERAVYRMLATPDLDNIMLAEVLGTTVQKLHELFESGRKHRR